jgi:DNA-binding beta-propeller fold protein YncE/thiol-disulfide isomerase/thioredoxin
MRYVRLMIPAVFLLTPLTSLPAQTAAPSAAKEEVAAEADTNGSEVQANEAATEGQAVDPFPGAKQVPDGILDGASEWLNTSSPLALKDLRGKIVLFDFWTYCCINCMHVLPDLKYLEEKYGNELVVIGVHSAKFDNEKVSQNIRDAILRYEIQHPVINDSEMLIWNRFGTRAWPTLALIDAEGRYIGSQGGEGNRELFDEVIGKLVVWHRANGTLNETPMKFDLEAARAAATPLRYPGKILADSASQRLFVTDSNHHRIVIAGFDGKVQKVIGSGRSGLNDGSFADAAFNRPQGVALVDNLLFVADTENHVLRIVDLDAETVTTLAGTGTQGHPGAETGMPLLQTQLNSPWAVIHSAGTLFIAMAGPHQIWSHQLGSDTITPYAGSGREDVINGSLTDSAFAQPSEMALDADGKAFYVVDSEGSSIRKVPTDPSGLVTTVAGTSELPRGQSLFAFGDVDAVGGEARFQHPLGIAFSESSLYVADSYNHKIRRIELATAAVTTFIGNGTPGTSLSPPQLSEPGGVSIADGKLYIADTNNHRICVADLKTAVMTELTLDGLTPPEPSAMAQNAANKTRVTPEAPGAAKVEAQTVKAGSELLVSIALAFPEGYKQNEMAPVTWDVFADSVDAAAAPVIAADVTGVRAEAEVKDGAAVFRIPLTGTAGQANLLLRLSYGYCSADASLCKLATAAWRIPLNVTADSEITEVKLNCPVPQD